MRSPRLGAYGQPVRQEQHPHADTDVGSSRRLTIRAGHTRGDDAVGQRMRHDRAGADDGLAADIGQHDGIAADPAARANADPTQRPGWS